MHNTAWGNERECRCAYLHLNNYDAASTSLKTDVIKIYGSSSKPTYTFTDRSIHLATAVAENWSNNVLTLTVQHNGPLDLTVKCAGKATGRLTDAKAANTIQQPAIPAVIWARANMRLRILT